tara:strand:+ start:1404 stop:1925 length:522 start_codon:yes stop_codon:yes gene_type:complete
LEYRGYYYLEIPTLISEKTVEKCLANTNNNAFKLDDMVLIPEATQYIANLGTNTLGKSKVYYIARCFRKELSTNANRLREFTQIGVEYLGDNPLDCCRDVRKDALWLFKQLKGNAGWKLVDNAERGLNIYVGDKAFEISSDSGIQLLGGGPYREGAGWAIGLERFMNDGQIRI